MEEGSQKMQALGLAAVWRAPMGTPATQCPRHTCRAPEPTHLQMTGPSNRTQLQSVCNSTSHLDLQRAGLDDSHLSMAAPLGSPLPFSVQQRRGHHKTMVTQNTRCHLERPSR
jgi:hypothetical protein